MLNRFGHVRLYYLWTVAHQAPMSMVLSRQKYWSESPFPPPGDLSNLGIEPGSPASGGGFFLDTPCKWNHTRCDLYAWLFSLSVFSHLCMVQYITVFSSILLVEKYSIVQAIIASESCSVASDSLPPHGPCNPWNSPGQNTGVGSLTLL